MKLLLMMPLAVAGWEWIILGLLVVLLFGGKKIPELMKGLGKGVKSFKEGMSEVEADVRQIKEDLNRPSDNAGTDDSSSPETK